MRLPSFSHPNEDYFIPFRMLLLARVIDKEIGRDLAPFEITVAEWRVLAQCCSRGSSSAAEIAAAFDADRAEVSRAVARLVKAKHVHREPDKSHRQKKRIIPTESGLAIFEGVRAVRETYFAEILQDLTLDERRAFNKAMHHMTLRVEERRSARKAEDPASSEE
jgi:DNA-binding MarR family transcriptional regulator